MVRSLFHKIFSRRRRDQAPKPWGSNVDEPPPLTPVRLAHRPHRFTYVGDANEQLQSSLITSLPAEIRLIIWELVIGREDDRDVLHMDPVEGRLRYNRCWEQRNLDRFSFQHLCWTGPWEERYRDSRLRGRHEQVYPSRKIRPVIFTCKLIYRESISLLYQTNTLDFRRIAGVLQLPDVMLPHRFQQLRRIHCGTAFNCLYPYPLPFARNPRIKEWQLPDDFTQWPAACAVLASLHNLEHVRVLVVLRCPMPSHNHPTDGSLVLEILEPLKAVRASDYEVTVTEPLTNVRPRLGTAPFRLLERAIQPFSEYGIPLD